MKSFAIGGVFQDNGPRLAVPCRGGLFCIRIVVAHQSRASKQSVSKCLPTQRRRGLPLVEALDRRTLLAVSFKFNIIDPTDKYKSVRTQLQTVLAAAAHEWSTHLSGNASLEYDVAFSETK